MIKADQTNEGSRTMNKNEMIKHMLYELASLKAEVDRNTEEYNKADHMDRIGMSMRKEKGETLYYHFWMICNDIGIVPRA